MRNRNLLFHLAVAVFWAIMVLFPVGCVTTCDTLQMRRDTQPDGKVKLTYKCGDKSVEHVVKKLPTCLEKCFDAAGAE